MPLLRTNLLPEQWQRMNTRSGKWSATATLQGNTVEADPLKQGQRAVPAVLLFSFQQ